MGAKAADTSINRTFLALSSYKYELKVSYMFGKILFIEVYIFVLTSVNSHYTIALVSDHENINRNDAFNAKILQFSLQFKRFLFL